MFIIGAILQKQATVDCFLGVMMDSVFHLELAVFTKDINFGAA